MNAQSQFVPVETPPDELERLYGRMPLIRTFEDAVERLFMQNEIQGTTHLYNGQEAVAVGVCAERAPGDAVAATYRGHGACLAMGTDPTALMTELLGRATGVCGGRAGTMNVIDLEHGIVGCFGIVGGSIAAATGVGLAARLKRDDSVAVAFFGDGAVNQAYFHECLNFAAVRGCPWSTSARTTSTASGRRWPRSPRAARSPHARRRMRSRAYR